MRIRGVFPRKPHAHGTTPGHEGDRFPGYDVLHEVPTWDAATAGMVLARLGPPPPLRFFNPRQEAIAGGLLDHLLDQRSEPRVPVLRLIDRRLSEHLTDGWRYEDMPPDDEAWRRSLDSLDADAHQMFDKEFPKLEWDEQGDIIQTVQALKSEQWHEMTAHKVWSLWTRYAAWAFYSHPWAWNEIGFGGPAYPRGYKNVGVNKRENWEVPDAYPERDPIQQIRAPERSRSLRAQLAKHYADQHKQDEAQQGDGQQEPKQGSQHESQQESQQDEGESQA